MAQTAQGLLVFVVGFVSGSGPGLHACRFDVATGELRVIASFSQGVSTPLYARADATGRFLYVADPVKETDGTPGGALAAYGIDPQTGTLNFLNRQPVNGVTPCYVTITSDGRFALVANYSDGSVSVLPIKPDGSLGTVRDRVQHQGADPKKKTNAHSVILDATGTVALAADLGADRVFLYRFDGQTGQLSPAGQPFVQTAVGAGPRHLAFGPGQQVLYAMTEYDNTVIALVYDAQGPGAKIIEAQPTLPADFTGKSYGADVHVHPSGRFLYATNRGHESIAIFAIDPASGKLTPVGHEPTRGKFPRCFALDPTGRWLLVGNEKSDNVVIFQIDPDTGRLTATGRELSIPRPACITFLP